MRARILLGQILAKTDLSPEQIRELVVEAQRELFSSAQKRVYHFVVSGGRVSSSEVAEWMGVTGPRANNILSELCVSGLVFREPEIGEDGILRYYYQEA